MSWSPGAPDASADPPPAAFRALKRGENYLAAVVVPMSQLGGLDPTHGTQVTRGRRQQWQGEVGRGGRGCSARDAGAEEGRGGQPGTHAVASLHFPRLVN